MRHTTRLPLTTLFLFGACMAPVGEDAGGSKRKPSDETPAGCESPKEITTAITIRSDADFAQVPTECWDLYSKLRIEGAGITSLQKLGKLKGVDHLEIVDTNLKTIDTQLPLAVWGSVTITGNKQLTSLANMPIDNADNLTAQYSIRDNPVLASLDGIKYVKAVEGELRIVDNPLLGDVALDELTTVTGALEIARTGATRIDLGSLQTVGRIDITGNTKLTTFDGIAATAIKGDFAIRGNAALKTLTGISSIQRIEGALTIDGAGLENLDAFTGLQFITSSLTITNNAALASLGRFNRLSGIGTSVTITGNAVLPYCAGHEIDHCVTSGAATVTNNKPNTENLQCACWCNPPQ